MAVLRQMTTITAALPVLLGARWWVHPGTRYVTEQVNLEDGVWSTPYSFHFVLTASPYLLHTFTFIKQISRLVGSRAGLRGASCNRKMSQALGAMTKTNRSLSAGLTPSESGQWSTGPFVDVKGRGGGWCRTMQERHWRYWSTL